MAAIVDDIANRRDEPLVETRIDAFPRWRRGKVRDVYDLGDRLLIVATDRLSAFDVVLPTGIPGKGVVLTQLSLFWFDLLKDVVPNHVDRAGKPVPALEPYARELEGRSMIVTRKMCQLSISAWFWSSGGGASAGSSGAGAGCE